MFRIIRCGSGFDPVIMVSPEYAGPDTPGATFYRWASWRIDDHLPGQFNEISAHEAISYFSGQADGIGFDVPPEETFPTLEAALACIDKLRNEAASLAAQSLEQSKNPQCQQGDSELPVRVNW